MNIALPHYRAPCVTPTECWAELRPQCPSIQVEPSPHSEGAVHIQADTPHRPAFTPHNCQTDLVKICMSQAIMISSITRKCNNIFWHLKPLSLFFSASDLWWIRLKRMVFINAHIYGYSGCVSIPFISLNSKLYKDQENEWQSVWVLPS